MTQPHLDPSHRRLSAATEDTPSSEGGCRSPAQAERERQMAQFGIGYDGLRYHRNGYRYDRLDDAVAYASLMHSRASREDTAGPFTQLRMVTLPTVAEQGLMASLAIRYDGGAYRFQGYRYDGLSDAVNYAKRAPERQ
jgi:hypothetical protein